MQSTFRTDTAWPDYMEVHFQHVHGEGTVESRYYGPYNVLLNYISGDPSRYQVAPQSSTVRVGRDLVDFVLWYEVKNRAGKVVMVAEVKDKASVLSPERRFLADERMRLRFGLLVGSSTTPRVYGISALGTAVCLYELDMAAGTISPPYAQRPDPSRILPADFLAERWGMDVLSQESFDALRSVMSDIDEMCTRA